MDADKFSAVSDKVLVDIVKLSQKQGRTGKNGSWKEFLNVHDRQMGSSLSDPTRRNRHTLLSFILTFTDPSDIKFVDYVLRLHFNRELINGIRKESPDNESPEQRLVRSTVEHPLFLSKYAFPSYEQDWVVTKLPKKPKLKRKNAVVAIDCEMVLCEDGTEALVRVCVVDRDLKVKLDEKVNPYRSVADYRTEITGVTAGELDGVTCSLADVQKSVKKLLGKGTILVGHGLYNDLKALKIDHPRVIDTSFIFRRMDGRPPSLVTLCKVVLNHELRKGGAPHNCIDDARAAMRLFLAKIERGVDNDIPVNQEDVLEAEMTKLFLHGIPTDIHSEELHGVFAEPFTIEIKPPKKGRSQYSAFAIFKDAQEANSAFKKLKGRLEKDNNGLLQKLITLKIKTGISANLYVRKMGPDQVLDQDSSKKRALQDDDVRDSKKLKRDDGDDHLKEIERLKQELKEESSNCEGHLKEIEKLKQELKEESSKSEEHLKEVGRLKQELKWKDIQISKQEKMIDSLNNQLKTKKK